MRKNTMEALATLDEWQKSYKRYRWIKNIWWGFIDAYCMPNSPVSECDAPEIERLQNKIEAWLDKAQSKWDAFEEAAYAIYKQYRRNQAVMARYKEIRHYIAVSEWDICE